VRVDGGAAAEALHALGAHRQHAVLVLQHAIDEQERLRTSTWRCVSNRSGRMITFEIPVSSSSVKDTTEPLALVPGRLDA
jgi:hypothetical protein